MAIAAGAIDLGGTKIEARLFDADLNTLASQRTPTPKDSFDHFLKGLVSQINWLQQQSNTPDLPIGLSIAGIFDPETGIATASNLPTSGKNLSAILDKSIGYHLPILTDSMAFTLSEAGGNNNHAPHTALGLILGTGVGAGLCIDGKPSRRHAGLPVEIGHIGMPARALDRHKLPLFECGCGRIACIENYVSGTGLSNIAEWAGLERLSAEELLQRCQNGDKKAQQVFDIWADLAGEMLYLAQLMLDPDEIILGGGLSKIPGIISLLEQSLLRLRLGSARLPSFRLASHGDSSGSRGAAIAALQLHSPQKTDQS